MNPIWNNKRVMVAFVNSEDHVLTAFSLTYASFLVTANEHIAAKRIYCEMGASMPLDFERSKLAQYAADPDNGFTHLYMHDADMSITVEHIERLLAREVDIVSGTYFMGGFQSASPDVEAKPFPCVAQFDGQYISRTAIAAAAERNELIEVHGTGAGSLLVTTDALRRMGGNLFQFQWRVTAGSGYKEGEDYHFCRIARTEGFKIWLDPTVQPDHFKLVRVGLCLRDMNGTFITTFDT